MAASTMSESFHEWLDQCPCQWFRISNNGNEAKYEFIEEDNN